MSLMIRAKRVFSKRNKKNIFRKIFFEKVFLKKSILEKLILKIVVLKKVFFEEKKVLKYGFLKRVF